MTPMNKKLVVFCSGYARSGKDTVARSILNFCSTKKIKAKIYSFAKALKEDLRPLIKEKFNIDTFTEDGFEKNLIRPILISYGNAARELTCGKYWWSIVKKEIDDDLFHNNYDVAIISDGRFCEYEKDELFFVKQYNPENKELKSISDNLIISIFRENVGPAHDSERRNIPAIAEQSDVVIKWPSLEGDFSKVPSYMDAVYEKIINKLY